MMQNIQTKSLDYLMKNKRLLIYVSSGNIFLLKENTEEHIVAIADDVCDCIFGVFDFGRKGKLCCHKFREDSAADIKEKLFNLFKENNISIHDLKKISIIQSDSEVQCIEKEDKIFLIKKNTKSFMCDDPNDIDLKDCDATDFEKITNIVSRKLQNLKDKNMTHEKYEAGMFVVDDTELLSISSDSDNESKRVYIEKHNPYSTVSENNKIILMQSLCEVFFMQNPEKNYDSIFLYLAGLSQEYKVEAGNNIYFDNTNNKVIYCNLDNAFKFHSYQKTLKYNTFVEQEIVDAYGEHPLLNNTEFSQEIVCETIDKKRLEEIITENKLMQIKIKNALENSSDKDSETSPKYRRNELKELQHNLQNIIKTKEKRGNSLD